jgi:lysophospholipase L1-like esterase
MTIIRKWFKGVAVMSLGKYKSTEMMQYVVLGDSLSTGVGMSFFSSGFPERYLYFAERKLRKPIYLNNFAQPRAVTEVVLQSIKVPFIEKKIQQAQIITLTAGGNDAIQAAETFIKFKDKKAFIKALHQCKQNMSALFEQINKLKQVEDRFIIRAANIYNPLPQATEAGYWINQFNKHLDSLASLPNVKIADIHSIFEGKEKDLLSKDQLFPNEMGYQKIAEAFDQLGYEPLL